MDADSAYNNIIGRLKKEGISFTIHEHKASRTVNDAEENLPFPKNHFSKPWSSNSKTPIGFWQR